MKVLKIGRKECEDCKIMGPRWQEIEEENPWLETEYIKADEKPEIIEEYHITAVPTFIFLNREGKEIRRFINIVEKEILVEVILEDRDK